MCMRFIAVCRILNSQEQQQRKGKGKGNGNNDYNYMDENLQRFRQDTSPNKERVPWSTSSTGKTGNDSSPLFNPRGTNNNSNNNNESEHEDEHEHEPVIVPPEEVENIKKDFFLQINFLFQIMKKVENRGFMFRLDFNEFISQLNATK